MLRCWDPQRRHNPLMDPSSVAHQQFPVRCQVHKIAFGSMHALILCDDDHQSHQVNPNKRMIVVYSWNQWNLLDKRLESIPSKNEIRFDVPILDIACTFMDGSIVLDSENNVRMWGTFNGQIKLYVEKMFSFKFREQGLMRNVFVTSKNILFLDAQNQIHYINYEKNFFQSLRKLATEEPILEIFANNSSANCILISQGHRMFVWDSGSLLYRITDWTLPDAYCLHVHQSTPKSTHIEFEEQSLRQLQIKLATFNNILHCDFPLLVNHHFTVWTNRCILFERIQSESHIFHRLFHLHGFDDHFIDSFCFILNRFPTPVVYAFLYYIHTGEIKTDATHLKDLARMARQCQCPRMISAIESKLKSSTTALVGKF
ncbi:BTB/POZ domain-containing protein 5 [Sarcoptes scabiei]|nr:BTB/POZ domain-containing protein 5 [Sarcoptes scabiei]